VEGWPEGLCEGVLVGWPLGQLGAADGWPEGRFDGLLLG
jgi:hypothetical protein